MLTHEFRVKLVVTLHSLNKTFSHLSRMSYSICIWVTQPLISIIQWATKVATPAPIRNAWKQGTWLLWPTVHNPANVTWRVLLTVNIAWDEFQLSLEKRALFAYLWGCFVRNFDTALRVAYVEQQRQAVWSKEPVRAATILTLVIPVLSITGPEALIHFPLLSYKGLGGGRPAQRRPSRIKRYYQGPTSPT